MAASKPNQPICPDLKETRGALPMKQFEQLLGSAVDAVNAELENLLPAAEGPEQRWDLS